MTGIFSVRVHKLVLMPYLRYLCLFVYGGVQHILCRVFILFIFVLCTILFQFLWIFHSWWPLCLIGSRDADHFSFLRYGFRLFVCLCPVSCSLCCICLWIAHFWFHLRYSVEFISYLVVDLTFNSFGITGDFVVNIRSVINKIHYE